jgi:hypothetical protein
VDQVLGIARLCCLEPGQVDSKFLYGRVLLCALGFEAVDLNGLQSELSAE